MKYTLLILVLLTIACGSKQEKAVAANAMDPVTAEDRPNIIIILVDDAGYIDFGFMGSEDLQTPEIDKMAASGTVFTDAHVSASVCAPSRAGLITGKYQQRFGFEANGTGGIGLSDSVTTMADLFKSNGYNTYALGKWHLGSDTSDQPNQRGFDEFYGFLSGSRSYFPLENPSEDKMLQHNGQWVKFEGYMTDVLGEQSVKFAEQSGEKPFFMYLAYNAVHTPMHAKEEDLEKFKDHPRQKLAAMTWSLDENVGKLRTKLKELGKLDNTLIYFLSDNGGAHNNQSKTGPLKGYKGNKFEGGHRVSFAVSWPSGFEGGGKFDGLTSSLDIFPTSLAAAGIKKPDSLVLDGVNLLSYLKGKKSGDPHESLFWRKLDKSAARIGDYKTITLDGYGSVMYNLRNDLGETNDLSETESVKFDSIQNAYNNWQSHLMQPLWDEGDIWMGICSHIHRRLMQNEEPDYKSPWSDAYKNRNDKKMKVIEIEYPGHADLEKVSRLLEEQTDLKAIDLVNWKAFSYRPDVKFRIAHSNDQIWLKFYVTENHILAQRTETNSATHRDSCVEFFLDPQQDGKYYNFEFNCIGVTHLAYGPDRREREFIDPELIQNQIQIESTLGENPFKEKSGGHSWEMTIVIPAEILIHDKINRLGGLQAKANFYKCGDDTSKPHYLSWNPVGTERPDFHRPEFFGTLVFE